MKLGPVAHVFHSLLESGIIQNIAACHFLYCCKEMTCCNVLYVPRFQKWVKKTGNQSEFHSERNYYLQNWYFSRVLGYLSYYVKHPQCTKKYVKIQYKIHKKMMGINKLCARKRIAAISNSDIKKRMMSIFFIVKKKNSNIDKKILINICTQ